MAPGLDAAAWGLLSGGKMDRKQEREQSTGWNLQGWAAALGNEARAAWVSHCSQASSFSEVDDGGLGILPPRPKDAPVQFQFVNLTELT